MLPLVAGYLMSQNSKIRISKVKILEELEKQLIYMIKVWSYNKRKELLLQLFSLFFFLNLFNKLNRISKIFMI